MTMIQSELRAIQSEPRMLADAELDAASGGQPREPQLPPDPVAWWAVLLISPVAHYFLF